MSRGKACGRKGEKEKSHFFPNPTVSHRTVMLTSFFFIKRTHFWESPLFLDHLSLFYFQYYIPSSVNRTIVCITRQIRYWSCTTPWTKASHRISSLTPTNCFDIDTRYRLSAMSSPESRSVKRPSKWIPYLSCVHPSQLCFAGSGSPLRLQVQVLRK